MKVKKFQDGEDHAEENSHQNDEIKMNFNDDYRYFSRSSIGILIQDKYCKCGRVRSAYDEKLSNYGVKTNEFYGVDKLANKVFEMNNKNAIYLTKKSLMLNQFLEYNDTSAICNEPSPNRLSLNNTKSQLECSALDVLQCPQDKNSRTLCLPISVFSDKRLVSLFRSVALYWFFCLNTVLAKGEIYKKKTLTVIDLHKTDPISSFAANLEIKISPDILQNFDDLSNDFLWKMIFKSSDHSSLLSYAEYSVENFQKELFKKAMLIMSVTYDLVQNADDRGNSTKRTSSIPGKKAICSKNVRKFLPDVSDYGYSGSSFNKNVWKKRAVKNRTKMSKKLCPYDRNERLHLLLPAEGFFSDEEIIDILGESTAMDDGVRIEGIEPLKEIFIEEEDESTDEEIDVDDSRPIGIKISPIGAELLAAGTSSMSVEISRINGEASSLSSEFKDEYYLPKGMLNGEDYPTYNMWNGISIAEDALPRQRPFGQLNQQQNGRNPPPPLERKDASILKPTKFKSYSLWESTIHANEDYIPNFESNENFSIYSMPYLPSQSAAERNVEPSRETRSAVYSLWQSPNIIDCLGTRKDPQNSNNRQAPVGRSPSFSRELNDSAARRNLMYFQPFMAGFVTLTNRGAFEYYRRSLDEPKRVRRHPLYIGCCIPNNTNVEITTTKVTIVDQFQDLTSPNIFQPIQPDVEVNIDMPGFYERSQSGTMFYNGRLLLTFKHETDSVCDPLNLFQPKFVVRGVNAACQTDFRNDVAGSLGNRSEMNIDGSWGRLNFLGSENEPKKERPDSKDSSWEEIARFMNASGVENLDAQTSADFKCPRNCT